jgi:glycosyltransferase involved in cell wall biosynthesis
MKFSLIIPCYNEEKNLEILINRCSDILKNNNCEIVLVNNGSYDNSKEILEKKNKSFTNLKVLHLQKNIGYGNGIVEGLKLATGDILGWTHADLQTDPSDFLQAINFFKNADDKIYVKGLRKKRILFDLLFTFGMNIFETLLFKNVMKDINAQPNVFTKNFFLSLDAFPNDYSLDLFFYVSAKKQQLKFHRFPVFFNKRLHGSSHWNSGLKSKLKFIIRTLSYSFKLKKKYKL